MRLKVWKIYDWKINDIDVEGKSPSVAFPQSECPMLNDRQRAIHTEENHLNGWKR